MDLTKLGHTSAELMSTLEEEETRPGAEIGEVIVLAEVRIPPNDEQEYGISYIQFRCSDPREWVQRGLLHAGLEEERVVADDDDEEDDE